jgi:NAD(P)-dependent dehydrogenase (short-subunit alcohol dehydrogenase family)
MEGLKDKVIVFAGAGGIATATARCLGQGGAKVVVGDVLLASAELAARTCGDAGGEGVAAVADISDEEQVKKLIELALSSYGRIDGLFNVAANLSPEEVARDTTVVDIEGMATNVAYQATKAGVGALTRHIARTYGKQRVRANSVSPGLVLTQQLKGFLPADVRDQVLLTTPSFRHGEPADIGAMAAFLLSDLGEWVTGQAICVDGGTTMRA